MKILVTGGNGQLGSEIKYLSQNYSNWTFNFTDVEDLDITNEPAIKEYFSKNGGFDYLINCAAYTAVDKAEDDVDIAEKINGTAPGLLAKVCKQHNTKMIHISTDYVFSGEQFRPYTENDSVDPRSAYGVSKLNGEVSVLAEQPDSMVIRTSWLYSRFGHNFVKVMQKYGSERDSLNVVFDQIGTPTHAYDLADSVLKIIEKVTSGIKDFQAGVYHFSNEGACSWYDFACNIMNLWQIDCVIHPITSEKYPQKAKRPFYSVLNKDKIKNNYDLAIDQWQKSLEMYKSLTD